MRDNKQLLSDKSAFIKGLLGYKRVKFQNEVLKAEVHKNESKNSHRETMIKYFWNNNGSWLPFSFFCSKSIQDVVADFEYECQSLQIA